MGQMLQATNGTPALQALRLYLAEKDAITGQSPRSVAGHEEHVRDTIGLIATELGFSPADVSLSEFTRDNVALAITTYRTLPDRRYTANPAAAPRWKSDETIRRRMSALSAFANWCVVTGRIEQNPLDSIERPKGRSHVPKALTLEAAHQLLAACDAGRWPERDRVLVWSYLGCGLRLSEGVATLLEDFIETGFLRVLGKGNKERHVPVLPPFAQAIVAYLPSRRAKLEQFGFDPDAERHLLIAGRPRENANVIGMDGKPTWSINLTGPGASARVSRLLQAAGLKRQGVNVHALRSTFATLALQSKAYSVRELQQQLGHSSLEHIVRYAEVSDSHLIAASRAHPLAG